MQDTTTNVFVGGMQVGARILSAPGIAVHVGSDQHGGGLTIIVLKAVATADQRAAFENVVKCAPLTGMKIVKHEKQLILASPKPEGSLISLPTLSWNLSERLEMFWRIAKLFQCFHARGIPVGPLPPKYVLVSSDIEPFILGPLMAPRGSAYAAPETVTEGKHSTAADVFSLGKLLYFCVATREPPRETDEVPRLAELLQYPAGLVRIIRKATCLDPARRYQVVDDVLADVSIYGRYEEVGMAHDEVEEANLGGLSLAPPRPNAALSMAPAPPPKEESAPPVMLGPVASPETRRRRWRGVGAFVIAAGFAMIVGHEAKTSGSMYPLPPGELSGLSRLVTEASISDEDPPVLLVQVDRSWLSLDRASQRQEASKILKTAWDRWGVSSGFVRTDDAVVAQYNKRNVMILSGALPDANSGAAANVNGGDPPRGTP